MSTKKINGSQLEQMLRNGLANLKTQESEINRLNVFPVSDGDTGTNMRLTLEHGIQYAYSTAVAGDYRLETALSGATARPTARS